MSLHVLIAGAGTAGCFLARELASRGLRVTVLESNSPDGLGHSWSDAVERRPLHEAGFSLPQRKGEYWLGSGVKGQDSPGLFEPHAITRLELFSPLGTPLGSVNFPMIVTDRRVLAKSLAYQAEEAGADFYWRTTATQLMYQESGGEGPQHVFVNGVKAEVQQKEPQSFRADVVVDATGAAGALRSTLPSHSGLAETHRSGDWARVHREVRRRDWQQAFTDPIPDHYQYGLFTGYRWTHQHHSTAIDIGAGVTWDSPGPDPSSLVEKLASLHPSVEPDILREGQGVCLLGPPLDQMVAPGFLVLGDAAGMSIPASGCGVGTALQAAQMARQAIMRAAAREKPGIQELWEFNRLFFRQGRGAHLSALSSVRRFLQGLSHDELEFLFHRQVVGMGQLEGALAGRLVTRKTREELPMLWRAKRRPGLLTRAARVQALAQSILAHYHNFPLAWEPEQFRAWLEQARQLHIRVSRLA